MHFLACVRHFMSLASSFSNMLQCIAFFVYLLCVYVCVCVCVCVFAFRTFKDRMNWLDEVWEFPSALYCVLSVSDPSVAFWGHLKKT
jgi:glycopeptide antibiotics resistance protein